MYTETKTLKNGVVIPGIALGTWQIPNDEVTQAVLSALDLGYRHIDTAIDYGNEEGVGLALQKTSVPRKDIFITSKVLAETKTYEGAKQAIEESLKRLNVDYIDLMLIHAPRPWAEMNSHATYFYYDENIQVWKALEEAYEEGKVRSIGVSNFGVSDLQNILDHCRIKPMVNQLCSHIGNLQKDAISLCQKHDILVTGYSPIGTGRLLNNKDIQEIADKYNVSLPQLCIRYLIQKNILPLPKTTHPEYMKINSDVNFNIASEDMDYLDTL